MSELGPCANAWAALYHPLQRPLSPWPRLPYHSQQIPQDLSYPYTLNDSIPTANLSIRPTRSMVSAVSQVSGP